MSEQATPESRDTYHVFLASPRDMDDERQMVRKFFEQYNRNYANRNNLEFEVIDWENYANIGVGRPQELITEQTLQRFRKSLVLVVGLLGQRFGTPTDIYESGTGLTAEGLPNIDWIKIPAGEITLEDDAGSHNLSRTTAVGLYSQGNSKQGVSDLSGNVWEWCLNGYDEPANTQTFGTFRRVVRGGSWNDFQDDARTSCCGSYTPVVRFTDFGFRLCCVFPI